MSTLDPLTCQVCGKEQAVGVAASPLGPFSVAYGRACLNKGAEPYWAILTTAASCGGMDGTADWFHDIVRVSLEVAGKTMDEFLLDVQTEIIDMDREDARHATDDD